MEEHDLFINLINAKGVGPKTACAILAMKDMSGLQNAIETGDVKYLCKFPKIGPKSAQQIILDLKGKLNVDYIVFHSQINMYLVYYQYSNPQPSLFYSFYF